MISQKKRYSLLLMLAAAFFQINANQRSSESEVRRIAESRYTGWKVVELTDLSVDDRRLWSTANRTASPGIAFGKFNGNCESYAVTLIKKNGSSIYQMLSFKDTSGWHELSESQKVDRVSVVSSAPPGRLDSIEGERVFSKYDVIVYETMEAGAIAYYWDGKQMHVAAISE